MNKEILQEKINLDSHLIEYVIYDRSKSTLEVKYKSGKHKGQVKVYPKFDSSAYEYIIGEKSPGKALVSVLAEMRKKESFFDKLSRVFNIF